MSVATYSDEVKLFSEYDFEKDESFQEGLKEILLLLEGKSEEEREEMIGRAKVFYFSKITNTRLSWEDLQRAQSLPNQDEDTIVKTDDTDEERPLTFAELSELIQSGKTHLIPNNKEIPNGTNTEQPSESTMKEIPKKPWEK